MNDSKTAQEQRLADIEAGYAQQDAQWRKQLEELPVGGECRLGSGWKWTRPTEKQYRERGLTHDAPVLLVRTSTGQYLVRSEMLPTDKVLVWQSA
jgi:hypothetical protein